jgi:preprotein translocase subunit SecG
MQTFITVVHVTTCILLVLVVLVQSGKGAEISSSLAGSSQTVFGSSGGANFFTRFTSALAALFMATSLGLTLMGSQSKKSVFDSLTASDLPAAASGAAAPGSSEALKSAPNKDALPQEESSAGASAPASSAGEQPKSEATKH